MVYGAVLTKYSFKNSTHVCGSFANFPYIF